jgi:hypothetical protein
MAYELHIAVAEGRAAVPEIGRVEADRIGPRVAVLDADGQEVEPIASLLQSARTQRLRQSSYRRIAVPLLRWFRLLWFLGVPWDQATADEVAVLLAWMSTSARHLARTSPGAPEVEAMGVKSVEPRRVGGYAQSTIDQSMKVIGNFYAFHGARGRGPLANPIPAFECPCQVPSSLVQGQPSLPLGEILGMKYDGLHRLGCRVHGEAARDPLCQS